MTSGAGLWKRLRAGACALACLLGVGTLAMAAEPVSSGTPERARAAVPDHSHASIGLPAAAPQAATPAREVRIGVLAFMRDESMAMDWRPLLQHLQDTLPAYRFSLQYFDHNGLNQAVESGSIDFLITNPGQYVELESRYGITRLLTLDSGMQEGGASGAAFGSTVIALRSRADLQQLQDLRNQRLAVVGQEAFAGYQILWGEMARIGMDPAVDSSRLIRTGLPMEQVVQAVLDGKADAGVIRTCLLESHPQWQQQLRVVAPMLLPGFPCASSTRLYPNWPVASLRGTSPELAKLLTASLLGMSVAQDRMSWSVPADYQSVHELFRTLQIGPYAYLREPTLMVLAQRYWPWVAGLALLIVLWIVYTVHVEHQVRARTAALQQALDMRDALEEKAREAKEQADHMARLSVLGELSSTLAHELNQPLAAIGNYARSLLRRADQQRLTDDAVRTAAGEMATQADRAADIVTRIRSFSRKRSAQSGPVSPVRLAQDAIALFRGMMVHPPTVLVDSRLPDEVLVDADALQIQQVLLNLLKNGWDATRELESGHQTLQLSVDGDAQNVRLSVQDDGEPVSAVALESLFQPFYTTKPDGLGLGLAICRTIAEAHGGRLDARAGDAGRGLKFTLSLPRYTPPNPEAVLHHDPA